MLGEVSGSARRGGAAPFVEEEDGDDRRRGSSPARWSRRRGLRRGTRVMAHPDRGRGGGAGGRRGSEVEGDGVLRLEEVLRAAAGGVLAAGWVEPRSRSDRGGEGARGTREWGWDRAGGGVG